MHVEIRKGDEKPNQYLIMAPETPTEDEFLLKLRVFWQEQDR